MKLNEFLEKQDFETAIYDPAEDEAGMRNPGQTRKPRLSLRHLNRLKKIRALRRLEDLKREDLLGIMYSTPDEAGGGGFGGPPGF